jgi:hypothetical protein
VVWNWEISHLVRNLYDFHSLACLFLFGNALTLTVLLKGSLLTFGETDGGVCGRRGRSREIVSGCLRHRILPKKKGGRRRVNYHFSIFIFFFPYLIQSDVCYGWKMQSGSQDIGSIISLTEVYQE